MKTPIRTTIVCLAFAALAIAAVNKTERLTPRRIAELTAPSDAPPPKAYKVEVSGLQRPFRAGPGKSGPISVVLPGVSQWGQRLKLEYRAIRRELG